MITFRDDQTDCAQRLVTAGFDEVIPLRRRTKIPAVQGWSQRGAATVDEARQWDAAGANVGMLAKNFPAIDIDVDDARLTARIVKLAREMVGTAPARIRGQRALLPYRTQNPFPKVKLSFSQDGVTYAVEVLGDGQQYLVHGGTPDKGAYQWLPVPLWETDGPDDLTWTDRESIERFLIALQEMLEDEGWSISATVGSVRSGLPEQESLKAPSLDELRRVLAFIPNDADWSSRDDWLKMIAALRGAGGGDHELEARQIASDWSAAWDAGGPEADLRGNAEQAFDSFTNGVTLGWNWILDQARARGYSNAADLFEVSKPPPDSAGNPRLVALRELNQTYAVVQVGKDVRVMQEHEDGDISLLSQGDFRFKFANRRVPGAASSGATEPLATAWINWPDRRQYEKLVFKPGEREVPATEYNLWRGWDVAPSASGSCDRFLSHLRDVVCDGDDDAYEWLLDLLADVFQNPQSKPGVTVALQGAQGAGKTIVGVVMKRLLGRYHLMAEKASQVVGNFNGHLRHCLMLQCEEAFWGGSKQAAGTLKHLVTSEYLMIEQKGIDSVEMRNFTRLLITTNEDVVWPTSIDDRRLAIFRVSSERVGDAGYFDALMEELEAGGYERLMHVLLSRSVDQGRLRQPPRTAALEAQAVESMSAEERWLRSLLEAGEIAGEVQEDGSASVALAILYDDYRDSVPRGAFIKNELAFASFVQRHLNPQRTGQRPRVQTKLRPEVRSTGYVLPPLSTLRERYSRRGRGAPQSWDQPDQWIAVTVWGTAFPRADDPREPSE